MKIYLFCLLLVVSPALAQTQLQKGDNVILIQTPDSAATALKKLGQAFVAQGFTVEKYDPQFLTLTLAPKVLTSTFSPTLLARANASVGANAVLQLSGDYKAEVMRRQISGAAQVAGSEKGVPTASFRALEKVALTYPGGKLSYKQQ